MLRRDSNPTCSAGYGPDAAPCLEAVLVGLGFQLFPGLGSSTPAGQDVPDVSQPGEPTHLRVYHTLSGKSRNRTLSCGFGGRLAALAYLPKGDRWDSNPRHPGSQPGALDHCATVPAPPERIELSHQASKARVCIHQQGWVARRTGLEPVISWLTTRRTLHLF